VPRPSVLRVDPETPDPRAIARAARILGAGGLVALPTETVYGLGADATNPAAVARIFAAKRRPASNPLIVHAVDMTMARDVVADWPDPAQRLAERFWPGPLTLVLPRSSRIPEIVTADQPTVGVRIPAQPVARELIAALGRPVAAPSANRSQGLSPTRAEHVLENLGDAVDLILDAGPTTVGIESTVVDLTTRTIVVLRPGWITPEAIEQATGLRVQLGTAEIATRAPARSPGQMARHYAPTTPLTWVEPFGLDVSDELAALLIVGHPEAAGMPGPAERRLLATPEEAARDLYAILHAWDARGFERIWVVPPPDAPQWTAIRDRLHRARTPRD
jgi:L-threonylcarbamoyladenylate synthase